MEFFQVIVIVCSIMVVPQTGLSPGNVTEAECFYIEDQQGVKKGKYAGLYETLEECNTRREIILEVLDDMLLLISHQSGVSSNCPKVIIE